MSARPLPPSAPLLRWDTLTPNTLDWLMQVEQQAYSHPWTRGNFLDALASGYETRLLRQGDELLGYFVAMRGVDETHLLNLTVAPAHQRQGWARRLLDRLVEHAVVSPKRAADCLDSILLKNARLPHAECQARLQKWRG